MSKARFHRGHTIMTRRALVFVLLAAASLAGAEPIAESPLSGMKRWGSGEFRRFGFLVYDATLWSAGSTPLLPPLALKLTYQRHIAGSDIVDVSIDEMRRLGNVDSAQLRSWKLQMAKLFPDVKPGDSILGVRLENAARFYYNDRFIGEIEDAEFARTFFDIWLSENTRAPALRSALLRAASS